MISSPDVRPTWVIFLISICTSLALNGCSRSKYRLQADREAYDVIAERNCDPRWTAANYGVDIDPRSRYFDPYDPDHSPMPTDDPASHDYMRFVDGKKGWKHWHDNGDRYELENPAWRAVLAEYVETTEDGSVKIDVDSALRLAYVHSPSHQNQLETLYLSALDVTGERFRLDTQFFGGYDARYNHQGGLIPPSLRYVPALGRFAISPAIAGDGVENNLVTLGRPFGANPALQARRQLATAGQLLAGFANSFVFEFTGGDANLTSSLANFSFIQPLLRGAGKDVALEQLTRDERNLLANLRAYGQFRQGFYTQVAIGELGVTGPQRGGSSTTLQSFSGSGGVSGYLGLLQQSQRIRNSEDNLSLQERTLARLEALYDNDLTTLVQVYQFRQSVEDQRSELLLSRNALKLALDRYKTGTLGLPPDLPVELDESLIRQFQLIPREATTIQDSLLILQRRVGEVAELLDLLGEIAELRNTLGALPVDVGVEPSREFLSDVVRVVEAVQPRLDDLQVDLAHLEEAGLAREQALTDEERQLIQVVKQRLREGPADLAKQFDEAKDKLRTLNSELSEQNKALTVSENVVWLGELLRLSQGCFLVQARARRVESEPIQVLTDLSELIELAQQLFDTVREDLAHMEAVVRQREQTMTNAERESFQLERARLSQLFNDLEHGPRGFDVAVTELERLRDGLSDQTRRETTRGLISWVQEFLQVVERLVLVPAQARLELIMVESINLGAEDAFQVALSNRLDFMNGRAALVDNWRLIQFNADALQSVVNVTADADVRTSRNNPVSFRAPTGTARLGLEFDAPITRLLERNTYRESLISYQRNRRNLIQSRDSLNLGIRALIRNLEQLRQNLEIQRRAVTIAMRRVDQTQLNLNPPRAPAQPGFRPGIDNTLATQLLGAQTALRNTQNSFLAVWLNYYATRMRLYRELGIMMLDPDGRWMEYPIEGSDTGVPLNGDDSGAEELPLPPMIPANWIQTAGPQSRSDGPPPVLVQATSYSVPIRTHGLQRLPPTENTSGTN
ncbi:MAG: TolC family protein [Planctomycetes bacterium]|nr:TolC family protein [Planctomycetota bacterium]